MYFVEVLLPIPLNKPFTYLINKEEFDYILPGMRVAVPFGKNKIYTALALKTHQTPPLLYEAKEIHSVIDVKPIVKSEQIKLWQWMASYYMCPIGDIYKNAIPSSLLLDNETLIIRNPNTETLKSELTDQELLIYEALEVRNVIKVDDVSKILNKKKTLNIINDLIDKQVIQLIDEVKEKYKPKIIKYVRLNPQYEDATALSNLLASLNNKHKQREVILGYFQLKNTSSNTVPYKDLATINPHALKSLINKDILQIYTLQIDRTDYYSDNVKATITLTPEQERAVIEIKNSFLNHNTTLLYGINSSGKTLIYIQLINEYLAQGKQCLLLLPEIALTTQIVARLRLHFGNRLAVFHSKYSQNERVEVWNQVLDNSEKAQVVVGTRSALFLPFNHLGVVIIDEEHDQSFKQYEPTPRYHTRETAIMLSQFHQSKTLLGSATPSIETYYNTQNQKFGLVDLNERYNRTIAPTIEIVDLKDCYFRKRMQGHFSHTLIEEISNTLEQNKQVIIFQNRRGFSPIVECLDCGHVPQCIHCNVSLTYHKIKNQLRCHYCSYSIANPTKCHSCSSSNLDTKGLGTEQIQIELEHLFPNHKTIRMDKDTTSSKFGYEKILEQFLTKEAQIMVGTQMIAKGLDFDNIGLVGVINADALLHFPDFRAHERCYQLLTQLAGRAGRNGGNSKIIIQTYNPKHHTIQEILNNNYQGVYQHEMNERATYQYPPYCKLIRITLKNKNYNKLSEASIWLSQAIRNSIPIVVLGPEEPSVNRIKNEFIRHILLKIPNNIKLNLTKDTLQKIIDSFNSINQYRNVRIILDIDTY
ncbi:MAG: primosomal protein N' [Bacteroidota bacterium]|nr:primosomal protein N' [Bacteroidota bacterium]